MTRLEDNLSPERIISIMMAILRLLRGGFSLQKRKFCSFPIHLSGLRTQAMLHVNSKFEVAEVCNIPTGAHNAQPYRDGLLVNDTAADCVRYVGRDGTQLAFNVPTYAEDEIEFAGIDSSKIARQGFGRGLCRIGERFVAGGSSPSTVSLYDMDRGEVVASVNLTMDIRNAIHGLEPWPYDD